MPIRIRHEDKSDNRAQATEKEGAIAVLSDELSACYADTQTMFRILCGSI